MHQFLPFLSFFFLKIGLDGNLANSQKCVKDVENIQARILVN